MITAYIGVVIGAAILALGIYGLIKGLINITVLVMGLFLLIAALKEIKCAEGAQMRAMIRRSWPWEGMPPRVRRLGCFRQDITI